MSLRESPLGELKVPLTWTAAVALIVAAVAVIAVLISDRHAEFRNQAYGATRGVADRVLTPVGDALSAPGRWTGSGVDAVRGYFFAVSENRRLKAELKEMGQWRDVALALRNENERYRTLLGLKTDPPIPMATARVVTDSRGPFANTRLANAGVERGIRIGNPVMSENGLVGRIIGVSTGASRVLLLTDTASKVPVMIDRTNARAILTGDGGPNPKLDYLRGQDPVKEGDRVITSGDGGLMPRGLPVGTAVKGLDGRWRVVLASDKSAIDFVRILLFQDFTQLANEKELERKEVPPPTAGAETVTPQLAAPPAAGPAKPGAPAAGAVVGAAAAGPAGAKPQPAAKPQVAAKTPAAKPGESKPVAKPGAATSKPAGARPGEPKAGEGKAVAKPTVAKPTAAKAAGKAGEPKTAAEKKATAKPPAKPGASTAAKTSGARPSAPRSEPKPSPADEEPPTP